MRILYVGPDYPGSNGRCWRDAFVELGHEVHTIDDETPLLPRPGLFPRLERKLRGGPAAPRITEVNALVASEARRFQPQLTMYVRGSYMFAETLECTATFGPNIAYMNDDMGNPACRTSNFHDLIRRLDCIFTTKSYNVAELHRAGAPRVLYIPNAYDPKIHFPAQPARDELPRYQGDVAFIGTFWPERADLLSSLLERPGEFQLNVWGAGWKAMNRVSHWDRAWSWRRLRPCVRGGTLWCEQLGKAIQANRISLGLLCHRNRDLHTSRSFEIPACAGFMLAERSEEHRLYFEEDKEAVYFSSRRELLDKIRFYLAHDAARRKIALAGYNRCLNSAATYSDRARFALEQIARGARKIHPVPGEPIPIGRQTGSS